MSYSPGYNSTLDAGLNNSGNPWSLTNPDPYTFRLELRAGDHWSRDYSTSIQRTEVQFNTPIFHQGDAVDIKYGLTVEPGATTTTEWTLLNQIQPIDAYQIPPFEIDLSSGDHMSIHIRNLSTPTGHQQTLWVDPNPIERGHTYQMDVQLQFGQNGYLHITRDGQTIVDYHGAIGLGDHPYDWNLDIYRPSVPNTLAVDFSHTQITTSSGTDYLTSTGWNTTQPSDWTSGTSDPPPASTGTGIGTDTGTGTGGSSSGSSAGGPSSNGSTTPTSNDTGTGTGTGTGASSSGSSTGGSSSSSSTTPTSNDTGTGTGASSSGSSTGGSSSSSSTSHDPTPHHTHHHHLHHNHHHHNHHHQIHHNDHHLDAQHDLLIGSHTHHSDLG